MNHRALLAFVWIVTGPVDFETVVSGTCKSAADCRKAAATYCELNGSKQASGIKSVYTVALKDGTGECVAYCANGLRGTATCQEPAPSPSPEPVQ